jgi:hypothetical protein
MALFKGRSVAIGDRGGIATQFIEQQKMKLIAITALALASLAVATPAFALNGVDAVLQCGNTPGCKATGNGIGGVIIYGPNGGTVECTTMESECFVLSEGRVSSAGKPRTLAPPPSLSDTGASPGAQGGGTFVVMGTIYSTPTPVPIQ